MPNILDYLTWRGDVAFSVSPPNEVVADFLCVDRSALSRELCRMRDERILDFSGAKIHLLNPTFLYGWN